MFWKCKREVMNSPENSPFLSSPPLGVPTNIITQKIPEEWAREAVCSPAAPGNSKIRLKEICPGLLEYMY
jgi:hypothetical protein